MAKTEKNLPSWNLDDLYTGINSKRLKADVAKYEKDAKAFEKKYAGKIVKLSGDALGQAFVEYEKLSDGPTKVSTYSSLLFAADMLDEKISAFHQNISDKFTEIASHLIFFGLEINKISDADLKKKLKAPMLKKYEPYIYQIRLGKPHQLSDELERFDLDVSATSHSWVRLYDEHHANIKYKYKGKDLSNAEIFNLLSNKNRKTRKEAAHVVAKTLQDNIKIFTLVTNVLAKDKSIDDKWRGYKKPISSRNLSNLVEDEVVDALLKTVKANYPKLAHRYYKVKAKWLGMKKMKYWDRNAPLPDSDDAYIPYAKAREIVLGAYRDFDPRIADIAQKFFDNNWIDVPPRKGKDSGAFSHPSSVTRHPYILMNYQGKIRDVMTLAHELGHGVHQYLSRQQGALLSDTPLTLAETASVFGEQLVFRAMLKAEKNPLRLKDMIAHKVEDMLNTVVRQVAFCEFERKVHEGRKNGELSPDDIGKIWMEVQTESLGPAFDFDPEYKVYWSYIPHFIHSPFYVYAYAFGDCLVNSLYAVYLDGLPNFQAKYLDMLKAGGTLRHKELLKPFGLDASKPDFWQKGLNIIDNFISQIENL